MFQYWRLNVEDKLTSNNKKHWYSLCLSGSGIANGTGVGTRKYFTWLLRSSLSFFSSEPTNEHTFPLMSNGSLMFTQRFAVKFFRKSFMYNMKVVTTH